MGSFPIGQNRLTHTGHGQVANQYGISALQGKKALLAEGNFFFVEVQSIGGGPVVCVRIRGI